MASLGLTGPTVANWAYWTLLGLTGLFLGLFWELLGPIAMTLLQDTKQQPKVVERLLLLHIEHWSQLMLVEQENIDPSTCN